MKRCALYRSHPLLFLFFLLLLRLLSLSFIVAWHIQFSWVELEVKEKAKTVLATSMIVIMVALVPKLYCDDDDGFFFTLKDFGRIFHCLIIHSLPVHLIFFFFFLKRRLAHARYFHSSGQDQSTVAQRAETTVAWVFPDKLHVSRLPDRFPYYAWTAACSAHSNFIGSRVYACLGVTCYLHFWQMTGVFYMSLRYHRGGMDTK